MRVHGPGQVFVTGRAELASRHEDNVRKFGQRVDLCSIQEIRLDAVDAMRGELFPKSALAEARNANNTRCRCGALRQLRERWPDFSPDSQNDDVAVHLRQVGDELRRRGGHHLFEVFGIAELFGQGHSIFCRDCNAALNGDANTRSPWRGHQWRQTVGENSPMNLRATENMNVPHPLDNVGGLSEDAAIEVPVLNSGRKRPFRGLSCLEVRATISIDFVQLLRCTDEYRHGGNNEKRFQG